MLPNQILSSLSPPSLAAILDCCVEVQLPLRTHLYDAEIVPSHAYFITSGMASIVTNMPDGGTTEIEIICHEGVVGGLHLLGDAPVTTDCFMQIVGTAQRIEFRKLRELFRDSLEIRSRILEYVQRQALVVSQMVACNRLHNAEQRMALWLLMASDRTSSTSLNVTQEFLAEMIGTRRTTVTAVASTLQQKHAIEYSRGTIQITDRVALEAAACYCYKVILKIAEVGLRESEVRRDAWERALARGGEPFLV